MAWYRANGTNVFAGDAVNQYNHYASRVQGGTPPAGAIVFWPHLSSWGHVAIADGAGGVYTTQGLDFAGLAVAHLSAAATAGWGASAGWVMP